MARRYRSNSSYKPSRRRASVPRKLSKRTHSAAFKAGAAASVAKPRQKNPPPGSSWGFVRGWFAGNNVASSKPKRRRSSGGSTRSTYGRKRYGSSSNRRRSSGRSWFSR